MIQERLLPAEATIPPTTTKNAQPTQETNSSTVHYIETSGYKFFGIENIPYAQFKNSYLSSYKHLSEEGERLTIHIVEIGLTDETKKDEPIPLRIDHGCPCMELHLPDHDCKQQRELAEQTMGRIGRGMMVYVNTESSAAMGHGVLHVMAHQREYQHAVLLGETEPTMMDYFRFAGIKDFDVRKHPEVASVIARRLEEIGYEDRKNPLIFLGSSPAKIESLQNGHNIPIADTARVVVAERRDRSKADLGYGNDEHITESGVYMEIVTQDDPKKLIPLEEIFPYYKDIIFETDTLMSENEKIYQEEQEAMIERELALLLNQPPTRRRTV